MTDSQVAFADWLKRELGADELRLEGWKASETGYSNETNIFEAHYTKGGQEQVEKLVHRLGPAGGKTMFKEYDLARQCRVVDYIGRNSSLPVPQIVAQDMEADRPHYVMKFVEGETPKDGHTVEDSYLCSGFLADGTPAQREQYFLSMVTNIAGLHQVPVSDEFQQYFSRATAGNTPLEQEINWWVDLHRWGKDYGDTPVAPDKYVDWLADNVPQMEDNSIVWGDARVANTLVRDYHAAAMLDWELATLGPGEQDLFFHLAMHDYREAQPNAPKLDGVPSHAEQIALYEEISGRKIRNAEFFKVFIAVRSCIIQLIYCKMVGMDFQDIVFPEIFMNQLGEFTGI